MIDRIAESVLLSWGWPRRVIAFLAGAASSLAMAPFHLVFVPFLTFPVLVWLLDGAVALKRGGGARRLGPAFGVGWWFGFGYFLAGLWWIGLAFLVDADDFGWLLPLAVVALPALLAAVWGLGAALAQLLWSDGPFRVFALAFGLGLAEWARGQLFSGFPWNAIGYALLPNDALMQAASIFGLYGLNILAVFVFAAPAALWPRASRRTAALLLPLLSLALLAGLFGFGWDRLHRAGPPDPQGRPLRIVQAGIAQSTKWQEENRGSILDRYKALSSPADAPLPPGTLLVWPETALPFALAREPEALRQIADLLPERSQLVTGAARLEQGPEAPLVFNTLHVVGEDGVIADGYDKVHLVPFGEFVPFSAGLRTLGLGPLLDVRGAFTAGSRRKTMMAGDGPRFAPLICYEAIFPGEVLPENGERPELILNVTNDTWFGRSPGPFQHLHQSRVRAVEEGLPLVRAANSGISVVTDGYGRVLARLGLDATGRIDARAPAPLAAPFAARHGLAVAVFLLVLSGVAGLLGRDRK